MLFTHPVFLFLFLPLVLGLYWLVGPRLRNLLLLVASLFFYAWGEGLFVAVMLASIVANHAFGLWVARGIERGGGKLAVGAAVAFNLGLLLLFKYANLFWDSLDALLEALAGSGLPPIAAAASAILTPAGLIEEPLPEFWRVRLPIGISFFTFQAMSYVIDVYRGQAGVQRNLLHFGVYISLFPQLIAGPIVRYRDIAEQLVRRHVDLEGFAWGVRRFAIGLGKKMLIANTAARPVDEIFGLPGSEVTTGAVWLALFAFTIQVYFDFSGYSDMAIGLGRMFGFRLLENFDYPYVSTSVTEFWRRWHISLSTWFRDYLYIPLGGSRLGEARTYANLLVVFFICGLWHGASWNLALWGLFHGLFMMVERLGLRALLERLPRVLQHAYLHLALMFSWVLFNELSLAASWETLLTMLGLGPEGAARYAGLWLDPFTVAMLAAGALFSLPVLPRLLAWRRGLEERGRLPRARRLVDLAAALAVLALLVASSTMSSAGTYNPFIYFRF